MSVGLTINYIHCVSKKRHRCNTL